MFVDQSATELRALLHATLGLCVLEDGLLWKLDPELGPVYFEPSRPDVGRTADGGSFILTKKGFRDYELKPTVPLP